MVDQDSFAALGLLFLVLQQAGLVFGLAETNTKLVKM